MRRSQHHPQVPDDLQQSIARRNHDLVEEPAQRLTRGVPLLVVFQAGGEAAKRDVAAFPPTVQFRYQRELEPPDPSEGFSQVEVMPFERRHDPSFTSRAVIVWCDGVLRRSRSGRRTPVSPDDVEVLEGRADVLRRFEADGWRLLGLSWQPEIADELTSSHVDDGFARMRELLGLAIEVEYCPHAAGPPVCWCGSPFPV